MWNLFAEDCLPLSIIKIKQVLADTQKCILIMKVIFIGEMLVQNINPLGGKMAEKKLREILANTICIRCQESECVCKEFNQALSDILKWIESKLPKEKDIPISESFEDVSDPQCSFERGVIAGGNQYHQQALENLGIKKEKKK